MDVSVNRPFKDRVTDLWVEWRRRNQYLDSMSNVKQPSRQQAINWVPAIWKSINLMQPSKQQAINWTSAAWESVSEELLASSFLICGISNNLGGTEDVLIRDSILRELDAEEDDSDVDEEDAEGIAPFSDPED